MEDTTYTYSNKLKYEVNPSEIKSLIIPGKFTSMKQVDLKDYINLEEIIFTGLKINLNGFYPNVFKKLKKVDFSKLILKSQMDSVIFDSCESIETIILPNNSNLVIGYKKHITVNSIRYVNFINECPNLKNIIFPKKMKDILPYSIKSCDSLKSIELTVTNIKEYGFPIFEDCNNLEEVIFGENVNKISFSADSNIKKIVIKNKSLNYIFYCRNMIYCDHKIDIELYNPNYYELMPYIKKDENHELYLLHNLCRKTGNVIYINNPDNLYKTKLIEFSKIWGIDGLESIKLPTDIKHYDINLTENEYSCLGPYNTPYSTVDFNIDLIFNDVVINNKELRHYSK